jgi:hypothetical protein
MVYKKRDVSVKKKINVFSGVVIFFIFVLAALIIHYSTNLTQVLYAPDCGVDQFLINCSVFNSKNIAWNSICNDSACCNESTFCVYGGGCYNFTSSHFISDSADDFFAICGSGNNWTGCDVSSLNCEICSSNDDWDQSCTFDGVSCSGSANYITPTGSCSASSSSLGYLCSKAQDGNTDTISAWASETQDDPQWIWFDLGDKKCISGVKIYVGTGYIDQVLNIEVSDNAIDWTPVATSFTIENEVGPNQKNFEEVNARYIRLYFTDTPIYASITEIEVLVRNSQESSNGCWVEAGDVNVGEYSIHNFLPYNSYNVFAYWSFDNQDISGEVYDDSGNGNNGSVHGATWVSDGGYVGDGAYEFDGIDDRISVPGSLDFSEISGEQNHTIDLWVKLNNDFNSSSNESLPIITKYGDPWHNVLLMFWGTDSSYDYVEDGSLVFKEESSQGSIFVSTSRNQWEANVWYHIVVVYEISDPSYDFAYVYIYINEELDTSIGPFSSSRRENWDFIPGDLNIGGGELDDKGDTNDPPVYKYFNGMVDRVRILTGSTEYPMPIGCCGDDSNEYFICNSGDSSDCACCSNKDHIVENGKCMEPETNDEPPPSNDGNGDKCEEDWNCSEWTECMPEGTKTRVCIDLNDCGTTKNKPLDSITCYYEQPVEPEECISNWLLIITSYTV